MSHLVIVLRSALRRRKALTAKTAGNATLSSAASRYAWWSLALAAFGMLASTQTLPAAETNAVSVATNPPVPVVESPEAIEHEYNQILEADDEAEAEVDKWIQDNNAFAAQGAGVPRSDLNRRILERFEPVRKKYEAFLQRHPNHVKAHIAFGSFLNDLHEEEAARQHWEKALALDPKNPAVYNNLANAFTHDGPITNAFIYYEKAIALNPLEPLYYHNLSDTVYAFRTDSKAYYGLTNDDQVYDKALELYRKTLKLDPQNFNYATDIAKSYYGIKPLRTEEALGAWTNALYLAHDEVEREGVYIHFARLKMLAGRFAEAHAHMEAVTNAMYDELKTRLARNLAKQEAEAKQKADAKPAAETNQPKP